MSYKYREDNLAIIDITKPPYNADNTGVKDCTEILRRAFDDILRPNAVNMKKTIEKLAAMEGPDGRISLIITVYLQKG